MNEFGLPAQPRFQPSSRPMSLDDIVGCRAAAKECIERNTMFARDVYRKTGGLPSTALTVADWFLLEVMGELSGESPKKEWLHLTNNSTRDGKHD